MACSADDEWSVDGVGIHAGLVVVMHRHESPISNYASNTDASITLVGGASDQILDCGGVEELDIWEGKNFGHEGRGEEGGVLDDNVVAFFFVGNAEVGQESISRLAHHHCGKELTSEPSSTTCRLSDTTERMSIEKGVATYQGRQKLR